MRLCLCGLLLVSLPAFSIENDSKLPDPLSLKFALALAEEPHPDLTEIDYALTIARSRTAIADSQSGLQFRAQARARLIDPPSPLEDHGRQDHQAKLLASKTIYDFGRSSFEVEAVKTHEAIEAIRLQQAKQIRRIQIMQAFFDVVLSDLTYVRDNEAMTMEYIRFDRAKERQELGQLSEVDVLEKENIYLERRKERYQSESLQRLLRNQFSIVVNRPDDIVSRFEVPALDYHKHKLIEVKTLQQYALENNLELKILRLSIEALRSRLQSIRSERNPILSAEAEAGIYKRNIGSNDRWRAGLVLEVPLYQGGKISHQINELQTQVKQLENALYQKTLALKQEVLGHWLAIDSLAAQKASSLKRFDYRELYLDRARAVYEMEVKSDLGDSMVQLSQAGLQAAETDIEIAMHWEELRILTQMTLEGMRQ